MSLFHDEEEHGGEPIRGLPAVPPRGETILWQGSPRPLAFAIHAFHIRFIAAYFAVATLWRVASIAATDGAASQISSVLVTSAIACVLSIAILSAIAYFMARATIYTITSKRVVLRFGVAIRKYVNLPFSSIKSAAVRRHGDKAGSIAVETEDKSKIAYFHLWPHARPMKFRKPQPMLRAIGDPDGVADVLCRAVKANAPSAVAIEKEKTAPRGAHASQPDVAPAM